MAAQEKPIKKLNSIDNVVRLLGAAVVVMSINVGAASKMNPDYPALPEPVTNNAVASVNTSEGYFYKRNGRKSRIYIFYIFFIL